MIVLHHRYRMLPVIEDQYTKINNSICINGLPLLTYYNKQRNRLKNTNNKINFFLSMNHVCIMKAIWCLQKVSGKQKQNKKN
jgi:hypothetical protein